MKDYREFEKERVVPAKDILHFLDEFTEQDVEELLGEEPDRVVGELGAVRHMLDGTGTAWVENADVTLGVDLEAELGNMEQVGDDVYVHRGEGRARGIWVREVTERLDTDTWERREMEGWKRTRLDSANVGRNPEYDVPLETFHPDAFVNNGELVKDDHRDIHRLELDGATVYAKEWDLSPVYGPAPPPRLTDLANVRTRTSFEEMDLALALDAEGVAVPEIVGYYHGPVRQYAFFEAVDGEAPSGHLDGDRDDIIRQDAAMLAALCRLGYEKYGFAEPEDKLWDGQDLYLVDFHEHGDLYARRGVSDEEFREALLDPSNPGDVGEFRAVQAEVLNSVLKDAVHDYRDSLLPAREHQEAYVRTFYRRTGLGSPSRAEMEELTDVEDHMTLARRQGLMGG